MDTRFKRRQLLSRHVSELVVVWIAPRGRHIATPSGLQQACLVQQPLVVDAAAAIALQRWGCRPSALVPLPTALVELEERHESCSGDGREPTAVGATATATAAGLVSTALCIA